MIKTGVDAVEIRRFSEMENLEAFVKRVFTRQESAYFAQKQNPYESIAGHYAAKEAFSKYMGTGMRGFGWKDIEIVHDSLGKPCIQFMGHPAPVDLSITHSKTTAVAVVCGEESAMAGERAQQIKAYQALLPRRRDDMHKGDCGRVFILAGSRGMTGAAALCAEAALRCGSGLVTVGTPASEQPVLAVKLTEAMTLPLPEKNGMLTPAALCQAVEQTGLSDACVVGPGLGRAPLLWQIAEGILETGKPVLLDADGLNALAGHIDILQRGQGEVVLTPHPGEMSRLCGLTVPEIESAREQVAAEFARRWGVTLLLKGKDTVIASPRGEIHINPTGNSGMATGGMGDVLSGVIGSFLGQGLRGYEAAVLGAFLHGLAGDLAAKRLGEFGMIAGDVVKQLPHAVRKLQNP